jgi:hypothetical protein
MATITPIAASEAGAAVTYAAATSGGDTLAAGVNGDTTLHVRNGGSTITLTMAGQHQCNQGVVHNAVFSIPAGDSEIEVPAHCIDIHGNVAITYSGVTTVTVAAVRHN